MLINKAEIKKIFIKYVLPILLTVAVFSTVVVISSSGEEQEYKNISASDYELEETTLKYIDAKPCDYSGYSPVVQSGDLTLYVNSQTSGVAVYDNSSGNTVTTIIPAEELEKANPYNAQSKAFMQSNFVLTAVNMDTGNTSEYTMYDQMQSEGKFLIENIENGVRITYLIGKIPKVFTVPEALSEKRYLEIKDSLSDADARSFENRYLKFDISKYYGTEKQEYIEKYPTCEKETIYILNNDKDFVKKALQEILLGIGYTDEDKEKDEAEVLSNTVTEEYTVFKIPMEFTIKAGKFSVSVLRDGIRYGSVALPVEIQICPYLMRGYTSDEGYILLPDGSGSLLRLNNGKTSADTYGVTVYGDDPVYYENFKTEDVLKANLPVFGISKQNGGVFAYINEIGAEAKITADVSGKVSDTNFAFAVFKLFGFKKELVSQDWTTSGNGTVYSVRIHGDKISGRDTVDFRFLKSGECAYSDMAVLYRNILKENGTLSQKHGNKNALMLNFLGSYNYIKSVLGVPVEADRIMTDMKTAKKIAVYLAEKSISADYRYLAAVNGGYRQTVANKLKITSGIGSLDEAKILNNIISENDGKLYYEIAFTKVYENTLFDGFGFSNDSVAKINTKHETFFEKDPVSFYYVKNGHYLLSPKNFGENINSIIKSINKFPSDAIAFRSIGNELYSDADDDNAFTKAQTAQKFSEAVEKAAEAGIKMMYSGGNEYVLKTASYITDLSPYSNRFEITDEAVPFYQMAVHGYVPYTYGNLSEAHNRTELLLYSIATGARVQETVSALSSSELKSTAYTNYYNTCWEDSKDRIAEEINFTIPVVSAVYDKEFLNFEYVAEDVTKSVYSGGVTVYVNFSETDITVEGKTVSAENYLIVN